MTELARDPRWQRLRDPAWTCGCCGESHGGVFDIAYGHPIAWPRENAAQPNSMLHATEGDILTEDFCRLDEHRMIRCILPVPIIGAPRGESFAFGVWATLAPENFAAMVERFDSGQDGLGPYFSWLANRLPGAPDAPSRCTMAPQPDRQRPILTLEDESNPWHARQREGITFDQLLDTYAFTGHDLRPYLGDA